MDKQDFIEAAAGRVIELQAELESSGEATTGGDELAFLRARLHEWVDTVAGVVVNAGLGRVTLIHADGRESGISSSQLPYLLSRPARFGETS